MALSEKVLWIVNMNTDNAETVFAKHALAINATAVCIRTSSNRLPTAISRFHDIGMKVYAWRWPAASSTGAMKEAAAVSGTYIPAGLDGYIVDPESDKAGASNDWNRKELAPLAVRFCAEIRKAAPKNFVFGTTSGCAYPAANMKPEIPWKQFFEASDLLFPQTYWRWTGPDGKKGERINGGTPAAAIRKAMPAWKSQADGKPIVPMAGEVDVVTPDEIASYGQELQKLGIERGDFYADNGSIPVANLAALKEL